MSRLYEALRRAEQDPEEEKSESEADQSAYSLSDYPREGDRGRRRAPLDANVAASVQSETIEAGPASSAGFPTTLESEPVTASAAPKGAAVRNECPYCGAPLDSQRPPGWLRWCFRLSRIPPHRCGACRRRFTTPKLRSTHANVEPRRVPGFLPPEDGLSFADVIQDMARDERERS